MDQTGIKEPFRSWIIDSCPGDAGDFLLGSVDFHNDVDNLDSDLDAPARPMAIVTRLQKMVIPLNLVYAHAPHMGPALSIFGLKEEVIPPYLLTDLLKVQAIGDREVEMHLTEVAQELFVRDWHTRVYPVETKEWFGILTRRSGNRVHLRAFSEIPGANICRGQVLTFTEWGDAERVGIIQ